MLLQNVLVSQNVEAQSMVAQSVEAQSVGGGRRAKYGSVVGSAF